ncbi:DNA mismatch repair protein MutS [Vallitalea sediminicola]
MFDSLLWLKESKIRNIDMGVIKDLNLHIIYKKLIEMSKENESLIYKLCMDEATIKYRQDIIADFMENPDFILDLENNLKGFWELKSKNGKLNNNLTNLYFLIDLVITVEASINCVESLNQTLLYYKPSSIGLNKLKDNIASIINKNKFKQMKKDLKEIRYIFSKIKGVELSINMSPVMRPYEAQVTQVSEYKYRYPKAFRKVSTAIEVNEKFLGTYLKNYAPVFSISKINWDLLDEIEHGLKEHKGILRSFMEKYTKIDTEPFISLLREITFYKSSCDLLKLMKANDLPLCKPMILPSDRKELNVSDCYNISLAYNMLSTIDEKHVSPEIIYNDFKMGQEGRVIILTGANRGGKTTFTQAIGQIQILAQLGLMIPASKAELSLVDGVYTHFPLLEKETVNLGKFGKECEDFSRLFKQATDRSLILLNESFSGTSHLESLKIAEEVVRAVKFKEIRMIYNTHLHELGIMASQINEESENDTLVISLVAGFSNGRNTYKIYEGQPLGVSHAKEIAEKYNVTYAQLVERLEEKT